MFCYVLFPSVDLEIAVSRAINEAHEVVPGKFHEEVAKMYSWDDVAERTEIVYFQMMKTTTLPLINRLERCAAFFQRLPSYFWVSHNLTYLQLRYYECGQFAGKLFCFFVALDYLLYIFLEWLFPRDSIDITVDFPYEKYQRLCRLAGQKNKDP